MTNDFESPLGEYFRSVEAVDVRGASDLVLELLDEGTPLPTITNEVLVPAQVRVGHLWETGDWSVADEHAATTVTEGALSALTHAGVPRRTRHLWHLAVACAEGEWHTLPARMAAAVAATGDGRVTVLGPSLPAEQLRRRLSVGDIHVLALSCTMPTNLIGAARSIEVAHELRIPVVVGGRAFGADARRAEAIGADGWAADPMALLQPPPQLAGRSSDVPFEVLLLDDPDEALITLAYERLVAAFPRLAELPPDHQARTREDLQWMSRYTAASLLTADPSVTEDLLLWLCRLLRGRVPGSTILVAARLLADTLEPEAPRGASILRETASRVEPTVRDVA